MIYEPSTQAVVFFFLFVAITLGLSFYLGSKAKSSQGYFTAHGQIPWFVNGIAFAGDYLSAASFLGICGMIAFYGYDGFLYSIGYLAGWIVALFVIAEPMKRLGRFTFADALDAKFESRGIKLAAGISTLAVSVFYLIPQMVGAGVLVQPLLGFPHWVGVVLVGVTVILIVVSAGMVSTTWVQFLKGSLLVLFSAILTWMIIERGFEVKAGGEDGYEFQTLGPVSSGAEFAALPALKGTTPIPPEGPWADTNFRRFRNNETGVVSVWSEAEIAPGQLVLREAQSETHTTDGETLVNGQVKGTKKGEAELHPVGNVTKLPGGESRTGKLGFLSFFSTLQNSEVVLWGNQKITEPDGTTTTVYFQKPTAGSQVLRPGEHPTFSGIRSTKLLDKLNFLSLMLALFCGTASLPHILIRYYTVKDAAAARKSTIVGIGSIGFFYVLTLYMGLGAMTSGSMDVTNSNMAAPLLARSMNEWLFAAISAIAFTTVLGTVSGLILASAGAVTHDLVTHAFGVELNDGEKVRVAKITSVFVGAIAIVLGIVFKEMNVSYLVGWAFSVAASANLPALVMLLFWKGTTRQGIIAAVVVGMTSSLGWILLSADTYTKVYGLPAGDALVPFSQPGIVTIPLGFLTLIVVSLMTQPKTVAE
ncbi:Cation/acetate symporter ActP [Symmachiella dynata]|uniref:Cation/acetate symporter ActP n=1 Tax=Symmachiella dynata TaxID=2527995 RepID=A0A517ZMN7_9PLAN|nr:cation acetate symporter [Symmachiella dynata]QDU43717.1 Cation/acetate symporter ActP [Symmachiella dynata]